ncbi:AAA family ATPase [Carnobacterium gallinarum]|uniref:AAA family ATPase n=1 Tax=Carnobacterium gallinarum TaxID=2749 RepID=UPI0005534F48|nr:AAA family ATPase [Carnobacterium gallinarum]
MSKLSKNTLNGKKIGIVFGTFAPCHLGHMEMIIRGKRENEACIVVVCGKENDRGTEVGLTLIKRFRYMRELFAKDENIFVTYLDETHMPEYPNGWSEWLAGVQLKIKEATRDVPETMTWYVGEKEYAAELTARTKDQVVLVDRSTVPISGTKIRQNPMKYWNYIAFPFRRVFSTNILVMGSASGGKSTLVQDLALSFGSPYTDEYARRYEEHYNVRDEELTINDFNYMGAGQFEQNKNAIMSQENNGLVFADTDVMVTKVYTKYYCNQKEYQQLAPSFDLLIAKQQWDIIFVIPPITKYVNDTFRDMSYADDTSRWQMHQLFMDEIERNQLLDKVVLLDQTGNDTTDSEGFYDRYQFARKTIKQYVYDKYQLNLN